MSTNLNYKQVANVSRRKWDVETYEKKAKARQEQEDQEQQGRDGPRKIASGDGDNNDREEFLPASGDAAGPEGSQRAFLKARKNRVTGIDDKVGSTEIISVEAATTNKTAANLKKDNESVVTKTGVGWHCKVCDCFLKDSHTYLDHINGRKHQRALGYSMRVERSTKDDVLEKLKQLTKDKSKKKNNETETATDYNDLVKQKDEEEKRLKEERQRKRKERKQRLKEEKKKSFEQPKDEDDGEEEQPIVDPANDNEEEEEAEEEIEAEGIDPAMAAMMGFSGFGGGGKNR